MTEDNQAALLHRARLQTIRARRDVRNAASLHHSALLDIMARQTVPTLLREAVEETERRAGLVGDSDSPATAKAKSR
jgi:hypothetical protein